MNKLILTTIIIGLALVTSQAEAGSHKNSKSKTACAHHCQPLRMQWRSP